MSNYGQLKNTKKRVKKEIRKLNIERAINSIASDSEVISFAGLLIGSTIVPTDPAAGVVLIGASTASAIECAKIGFNSYYAKPLIKAKKQKLQEVQEELNLHEEIYEERRRSLKHIAKEEKNKSKSLKKRKM